MWFRNVPTAVPSAPLPGTSPRTQPKQVVEAHTSSRLPRLTTQPGRGINDTQPSATKVVASQGLPKRFSAEILIQLPTRPIRGGHSEFFREANRPAPNEARLRRKPRG